VTPRYAAAIDGIMLQPSPTPRTTRIAEVTVYGVWAVSLVSAIVPVVMISSPTSVTGPPPI
jgi:hypothetical protein